MAWFKRNYGLVIAGVVALALLGFAGYYLYLMKGRAGEATAKLDDATTKLKTLYGRNPFPNNENIAAAKGDEKKVEEFIQGLKPYFRPPAYPTNVSNREFGSLLDTTLSELRRLAKASEITIPQDYNFSFQSQVQSVNIPTNALETLALQLTEVETICRILMRAGINTLDSIRRPTVTTGEGALGASDFVSGKSVTNEWTITTPYEVTFRGFSENLARVLEGFAKAVNCIVVQNLAVEHVDPAAPGVADAAAMPYSAPMMDNPYSRYGQQFRGGADRRMRAPMIAPPPMVAPGVKPASTNILEERQLKFNLVLETVRLNPKPGVVPVAAAPAEVPAPDPAAAAPPDRPIQ